MSTAIPGSRWAMPAYAGVDGGLKKNSGELDTEWRIRQAVDAIMPSNRDARHRLHSCASILALSRGLADDIAMCPYTMPKDATVSLEDSQRLHHVLLSSLVPGPIAHAAYFGCGFDAEWLMQVANPRQGWLLDRVPASAASGFSPVESTREAAARLQNDVASDRVESEPYGFYHAETDYAGGTGQYVLANLKSIGAQNIRVEAVDDRRIDVHFDWRHPTESTSTPRTISLVHCPDEVESQPALLEYLQKTTPPMQFLMTRGYNGIGKRAPALDQLANNLEAHAVAYLDFDPKLNCLQPIAASSTGRNWSLHGDLHVYRRANP